MPHKPSELLKKNVDRQLTALNWSRNELARRMGDAPAMVSNWLSGKTSPSLEKIALIAETLGVPLAELFIENSQVVPNPPHTLNDCLDTLVTSIAKAEGFDPTKVLHDLEKKHQSEVERHDPRWKAAEPSPDKPKKK